jgi:deazaflavin-dependent oxidoreductase (nitroreductase family)
VTASKETLKERLSRYRQIKISVIGRKSGRTVSIPVWFVLEGDKLYLLPVQGSDTQWYKNVLQNPSIRIDARGAEAKLRAQPITEPNLVRILSPVRLPVSPPGRSNVPASRKTFMRSRGFPE